MHTPAQLTDQQAIHDFVYSGRAVFTLKSKKTGKHLTFRVRKSDRDHFFFVDALTGPQNTEDFSWLGTISRDKFTNAYFFLHGKRSHVGPTAPSVKTIFWFVKELAKIDHNKLDQVEFWHEGRCGRCGRALTDPDSIALGLGPVCRDKA